MRNLSLMSPASPRRLALWPRTVAWIVAGALLYAVGVGHLLHPWLHSHHQSHTAGRQAAPGQALAASAVHLEAGDCVFCAFLAHWNAHTEPAALELAPVRPPRSVLLAPAAVCPAPPDLHLAGSRSPPSLSPA